MTRRIARWVVRHLASFFALDSLWFDDGPTRTEMMRGLSLSNKPQKVVRPTPSDRVRHEPLPARRDNVRKIR